eukprot:TRINITY_DN8583_c0_g1_i4.p1 TRINITY_DN8583_c0_g1~~TRINITY_DN8583_c0_g1_i4.p1  ORF type:complete len:1258 (+),score=114.90 TRINITY_DN8583_c0_g1_i4:167-3775(+)
MVEGLAAYAAADIDFRKNFEPDLVARFGPPIITVPNLRPGLRIRLQFGTSHSSMVVGVSTALDYFLGQNGIDTVHGILGGFHSEICLQVASIAAVFQIPQIAFGCSSPKLSSKESYPYFLRTYPSLTLSGSAMWSAMGHFNIPSVIFMFTQEAYGEGLYAWFVHLATMAKQAFRVSGVGIPSTKLNYNVSLHQELLAAVRAKTSRTLAMGMTGWHFTALLHVFELEEMSFGSFQMMGSEACILSTALDVLRPVYGRPVGFLRFTPSTVGSLFPKFDEMWKKMLRDDVVGDAAVTRYSMDKMKVLLKDSLDRPISNDTFQNTRLTMRPVIGPIFDGFYTFVHAINDLLNEGRNVSDIKGKVLLDKLKVISFLGVSGTLAFDGNGDRLLLVRIGNSQRSPDDPNSTINVDVGTLDTVTGKYSFFEGTEVIWADGLPGNELPVSFTRCKRGNAKDETGSCQKCPPGTVSVGVDEPCMRCPAGTRANLERAAYFCVDCDPGTYAAESGSTQCNYCEPGFFQQLYNGTGCDRCDIGFFQEEPGMPKCSECGENQATAFQGATRASDCKCKAGFFTDSAQQECKPCPKGMECALGSDMSLYWSWNDAGRPEKSAETVFPMLSTGYSSLATDPLSVFVCVDVNRCPGGAPGSCAENIAVDLISCARCEEGWWWAGKSCLKCTPIEESIFLFPLIPLTLGPMVISLLYFMFRDDVAKWGSWQNGLSTFLFVLLNHYQMTNLAYKANIDWPARAQGYMSSFAFTDDVAAVFKPECNGIASFEQAVALRSVTPLIGAGLFIFTWCISCVAQGCVKRPVRMEVKRLLNLFFSFILTFFSGIASMCLTIFQCHSNPNGHRTLSADESVICGGETWQRVSVIAGFAVLVYLVGCGALFTWAIVVAPKRFRSLTFQRQWKFLFIKYRPEVYWWSMPFMMKGVMMNAIFPLMEAGVQQLNAMLGVAVFYLLCSVHWLPWRHIATSLLDIHSHICIIVVLGLSGWFARSTISDDDVMDRFNRSISLWIVFVNLSPFMCAVGLSWLLARHQNQGDSSRLVEMAGHIADLQSRNREDVGSFLRGISEWDRYYLQKASAVFEVEFAGTDGRRATGNIVTRDKLLPSKEIVEAQTLVDNSHAEECSVGSSGAANGVEVGETRGDKKAVTKDDVLSNMTTHPGLSLIEAPGEVHHGVTSMKGAPAVMPLRPASVLVVDHDADS